MEAIILAGGTGSRLSNELNGLPKCLAPVNGIPFINFLINYLRKEGTTHFIFALGYKSEMVIAHLDQQYPALSKQYVTEEEPLGTGGAVSKALGYTKEQNIVIANGDTFFNISLAALTGFHIANDATISIALKTVDNTGRFGTVELDEKNKIIAFKEKAAAEKGLINGGIYIINKEKFLARQMPPRYSLEKDYFEQDTASKNIYGKISDGYFMDIGVPQDYRQFMSDHPLPSTDLSVIDKSWTLFLDRDGVINHEKHKDYIHTWEEFRFYDDVPEALRKLAAHFNRIIVVTNQKGIGKGLTQPADLALIHENMKQAVEAAGGRFDAIYFSPHLEDDHPERKPNPGMGLQAAAAFSDIDLRKSVMVGNTMSDMQFGRNIGAITIFLTTTRPETDLADNRIDAAYNSLPDFANAIDAL